MNLKNVVTVLFLVGSFSSHAYDWKPQWDSFSGSILSVKNKTKMKRVSARSTKRVKGVSIKIEGCVATLGLSDLAFVLGLKRFKPNLKSCDENELIIAPTYYRTTAADNCMVHTQRIFVPLPRGCSFRANSGKVIIDHDYVK